MPPDDSQLHRRFRRVSDLVHKLADEVLDAPWLIASHGTRLSDFTSLAPIQQIQTRIRTAFGVDPATLPDDHLLTLFERYRELHPLVHDSPEDAVIWTLRLNSLIEPQDSPPPSLISGILSTLTKSNNVKSLESRLPAVFWSALGKKKSDAFNQWGWLAEDLWLIRQPGAR